MTIQLHQSGISADTLSAMMATAHQAANLGRAAILPHFRRAIDVENKAEAGGFDPVTLADRDGERAIRAHIETHWQDHGIIGEELGRLRESACVQWIIDPIDGTRSFIIGSPLWGILIGVTGNDVPILGMLDQPFTRERFFADHNGAFLTTADQLEPRQLSTRSCTKLEDAVVATTHPDHFATDADLQRFFELKKRVRLSRYGGDCYNYGLLAAGFVDLVVESGLSAYDIVALIPIIEQAGGRITTWDGQPATHGGRIVAAGDAALHEAAMSILAS